MWREATAKYKEQINPRINTILAKGTKAGREHTEPIKGTLDTGFPTPTIRNCTQWHTVCFSQEYAQALLKLPSVLHRQVYIRARLVGCGKRRHKYEGSNDSCDLRLESSLSVKV